MIMPEYEFECCVTGVYSGSVIAKNKKEAEEKSIEEMDFNDLQPDGDITITRIKKENK